MFNFFVFVALIILLSLTRYIYFKFLTKYEICSEGIKISIFCIKINYITYNEILSTKLNSEPYVDMEYKATNPQNQLPISRIRIVVKRFSDPFLTPFNSEKKYVLYIIYPFNTVKFYFELLNEMEKYKRNL